jgi:hypothetical protein
MSGVPLTFAALGTIALGAAVCRPRGSRDTRFPFLFGPVKNPTPGSNFWPHKPGGPTRIWTLPSEVIEATVHRSMTEPTGERVLVYADVPGARLKRAIAVVTLKDADGSWRTGWVRLDGDDRDRMGDIKILPVSSSLDALRQGQWKNIRAIDVSEHRPDLGIRRISDTVYGSGSAARSPIRKAAIAKGEVLYHGTSAKEPFTHPDAPAWFSQVEATAEWFVNWAGDGPRPRVLSFRATRRIPNLLLLRDSAEIGAVMEHLVPYDPPEDPQSMAEAVCDAGYAGWRVPGNYPDGGDDILLCDDRVIESLEPIGVRRALRSRR